MMTQEYQETGNVLPGREVQYPVFFSLVRYHLKNPGYCRLRSGPGEKEGGKKITRTDCPMVKVLGLTRDFIVKGVLMY